MILIVSATLFLSAANIIEDFSKDNCLSVLATITSWIGYIVRPTLVFLFIILCGTKLTKKQTILTAIPLVINLIIISGTFIPGIKDHVYRFVLSEDETHLNYLGGPLRYSSHIVALLYLSWIIYLSIAKLRAKHFYHAIGSLVCALFIILAVVIETFINNGAEIYLLNSTVAVTALEYYIFLYTEQTQVDSLTGLFNRETLFIDIERMGRSITGIIEIERMGRSITGIIEFDMNGLKYLNDNFGHTEGDKGIKTIAGIIKEVAKKDMYLYRVGGDEFAILAVDSSEEDLKETIAKFIEELSKTSYYCSVGYSYRGHENMSFNEMNKEAEKRMYKAKDEFYRNSPFERRIIK